MKNNNVMSLYYSTKSEEQRTSLVVCCSQPLVDLNLRSLNLRAPTVTREFSENYGLCNTVVELLRN